MKTFSILSIFLLVFLGIGLPVQAENDLETSVYLWRLVNEARVMPLETLKRFGIDETTARAALGADQWMLDQGLPPLAWNQQLHVSARRHMEDMGENLFYSNQSLDGRSVSDRIAEVGYQAVMGGETLGALAFSAIIEPPEAARFIFEYWLRDELDPAIEVQRHIFNGDLTEIGVAFVGLRLNLGEDLPQNVYLTVADFAQPVEARAFILGNVYPEGEGDGIFRPKNGVPGLDVVLSIPGENLELRTRSGLVGAYQIFAPPGRITVEARTGDGQVVAERGVVVTDSNQWVDLDFALDR